MAVTGGGEVLSSGNFHYKFCQMPSNELNLDQDS
jgi:hypothetical protein